MHVRIPASWITEYGNYIQQLKSTRVDFSLKYTNRSQTFFKGYLQRVVVFWIEVHNVFQIPIFNRAWDSDNEKKKKTLSNASLTVVLYVQSPT